MNGQKQWPTFKAGDEVYNLRKVEWGVIEERDDYEYPLINNEWQECFTEDGRYNSISKKPSLLTYNPFDPFDPKNRDMPEWMQEYVNSKKDVHDMDVVDIPTDLDEIKRKIYAREMAIESNNSEDTVICVTIFWPNDPNTVIMTGANKFYYQDEEYENEWDINDTNPCPSSILATELLRLIENETMPESTESHMYVDATAPTSPITPNHYKQPDPFEIAEIYGVNPPIADAVKYILRAGNKDASKYLEDLQKAIKCIQREVELSNKYRGGKK